VKSARPSLTAGRFSSLMNIVLTRMCPAMSGAEYGALPKVRMQHSSTSCRPLARSTSASISTYGTEQFPVMKTRCPDSMRLTASSAVVTRWR